MIADWNRKTFKKNQVFHFKNSLRPFIDVSDENNTFFLDLEKMRVYDYDDLEYEGLFFYEDDEDLDFMGVELDGEIKWEREE